MVCPLAGFFVWGPGWLLHLPHSWLFQEWKPNFSEWPQEVVLHLLIWVGKVFGLVTDTRLHFFATTLGLGWNDLLAKGVMMVCQCLINSTIFIFNDG